jgi:hypothetical protein
MPRPEESSPRSIPADGVSKPRHVLAISTFYPWPQNHGDALRRLMILEAAGENAVVTALCVRRADTTPADVAALEERLQGAAVASFPVWLDGYSRLRSRSRRFLRGLMGIRPPWLLKQWSQELKDHLTSLATTDNPFDAVVLVGESAGQYARQVAAPKIIWDKSNVLTASNLDAVTTVSSIAGKLRSLSMLPLSYAYERRTLKHVSDVWVTSDAEAHRLQTIFDREADAVIPSAVVLPARPAITDYGSKTLVWMSTFSYAPNWDGLIRLLKACGDTFTQEGLRLRVIGAGATAAQEAVLRSYPFVDYLGFADDLADACDGAAAAVVPVWSGAGVKLKTLTLMSLRLPVIATPVAMEGIPKVAAHAIAETEEDFNQEILSLTSESLGLSAVKAFEIVKHEYSSERFRRRVQAHL